MNKNLPKSNYLRYYFGIRLTDNSRIVTTSGTKLANFIGVCRMTVTKALKEHGHKTTSSYIIGVTDELIRQDKGDRRKFKKNASKYLDMISTTIEYYQEQKNTLSDSNV